METTLPLPFLPSVDLGKGATEAEEGLTRIQLSYLGCVHFTASDETLDILLQFLQRHSSIESYVDVTSISSEADVITVLDAGARKVFVKSAQLEALTKYGDRVIPVASSTDASSSQEYSNGVYISLIESPQTLTSTLENLRSLKTNPIFLKDSAIDSTSSSIIELAQQYSIVPIIPATSLSIEQEPKDKISVPGFIGAVWNSDRADKLIPTVVTDERGIALGLVYSSQESLAESLKTGTGVYQSRKRGLWYKGASSGDTQELVRISLDCDQDCLKFVVRQQGRGMCSCGLSWIISDSEKDFATSLNQHVSVNYVGYRS
jgi:phosphoribosyl-ATP pyrophosphohydrolase/phosphoribosyl-AMP cyclohydrolase/histidinol dehydrogenase